MTQSETEQARRTAGRCPKCGSGDIYYGESTIDALTGGAAHYDLTCHACGCSEDKYPDVAFVATDPVGEPPRRGGTVVREV